MREDAGGGDHSGSEPSDDPERQPTGGPEPEPDRAGGVPASDGDEYICEICGSPMLERHCKIVCPVCGYQRDCSDP